MDLQPKILQILTVGQVNPSNGSFTQDTVYPNRNGCVITSVAVWVKSHHTPTAGSRDRGFGLDQTRTTELAVVSLAWVNEATLTLGDRSCGCLL